MIRQYPATESVTLNAAEVAQIRYRCAVLQRIAGTSHSTPAHNQARLILQVLAKAERREARQLKKANQITKP